MPYKMEIQMQAPTLSLDSETKKSKENAEVVGTWALLKWPINFKQEITHNFLGAKSHKL